MKLHFSWKTLRSKILHKNPWYSILHDQVVRPDGKKGEYFVVKTKGPSVFVVAVNARKEICLIKVHRYPTQMVSLEVPAGNSEGQKPLRAARRELLEETGYKAKRWRKAGVWQPMNGLLREMSHVFIATNLTQSRQEFDRHEGIAEVRFIRARKVLEMIISGKITDGQSIVALVLAGSKLGWFKFC